MGLSALIKPALSIGGSLLGGIGGAGKQQSKTFTNTNTQTGSSFEESNTNQLQHNIENPLFAAFREGLLPQYAKELGSAQAPVYGDAQISDYMQNLNKLGKSSIDSLRSTLARSGALNSGRFAADAGAITRDVMGKKSQFLAQLPFMESQAHAERVLPMLGLGINWAGRAPIDQQLTGHATDSKSFNQSSITNGSEDIAGPSMWRGFANNIGGLFGAGANGQGPFAGLGNIGWGSKNRDTGLMN